MYLSFEFTIVIVGNKPEYDQLYYQASNKRVLTFTSVLVHMLIPNDNAMYILHYYRKFLF